MAFSFLPEEGVANSQFIGISKLQNAFPIRFSLPKGKVTMYFLKTLCFRQCGNLNLRMQIQSRWIRNLTLHLVIHDKIGSFTFQIDPIAKYRWKERSQWPYQYLI